MSRSILGWTLAIVLALSSGLAEARYLELTFDDGPDGSGPVEGREELNNLETRTAQLGAGLLSAVFTGTAHRSTIDEGRYGRAADFDGAGAIEVTGFEGVSQEVTVYLWILPRGDGSVLELDDSFSVTVEAGALAVVTGAGETVTPLGASIPLDGGFHHLALTINRSLNPPTFRANVDFNAGASVAVVIGPATTPLLRIGNGLDGLIDELQIDSGTPGPGNSFDFDPTSCATGLECVEETVVVTPREFPHPVPVRYKVLWDPALCSDSTACPLVFEISGGNACADDYSSPNTIVDLAEAGFLVVAVDLYCESGGNTSAFPTETSQLIAVKDHLFSTWASRIEGTEYYATGCSHGAGTVTAWMLNEEDHAARTYARSPSLDVFCGHEAGVFCPNVAESREERAIEAFGSFDPELPEFQAIHERMSTAEDISPEIASTREVALSFGAVIDDPICSQTGGWLCNEQGLYGMIYGAQRFRDMWQLMEPETPTGYFVQDRAAECRHCAPAGSGAFRCGTCLLRYGRGGMASECPECLSYELEGIGPGEPGELCTLDASWYQDPLAVVDPPVDGDVGGEDIGGDSDVAGADVGVDGGGSTTSDMGTEGSGGTSEPDDGCATAPTRARAPLGLLGVVFFAIGIRRRRR